MSKRPILAYYGDDLTGSTDVMEALVTRGLPTVLFTGIPTEAQRQRFAGVQAIGIAGTSRSETPDWMDANLPAFFGWLKRQGAAITHYKVCSTFDSSPRTGSIGRALDIGAAVFGQACVPVVVGAPALRRYTAFGHLFAGFRGEAFRIDRHPVMSRHPVTPMDEADLRRHLARQTGRAVGLVDLTKLQPGIPDEAVDAAIGGSGAVVFDVLDAQTLAAVGRHLWRLRESMPFVVGSSGIEYALAAVWGERPAARGRLDAPPAAPRDRIAVVSGSCSPTTGRQIRHALAHGFGGIAVDHARLASEGAAGEMRRAAGEAAAILESGRSPLVYTALGEADASARAEGAGHAVGRNLGRLLAEIVRRHGLRRAVVAGGDTSSHALSALGLYALELAVPLPHTPGSPLCRAAGDDPVFDGLEIAFKGGQVGDDAYFSAIRDAAEPSA